MTCIPEITSCINLTRSSVLKAVLKRKLELSFPQKICSGTNKSKNKTPNIVLIPISLYIINETAMTCKGPVKKIK